MSPEWKDKPDAPGLWLEQRHWGKNGDSFDGARVDGPRLVIIALTGAGYKFCDKEGRPLYSVDAILQNYGPGKVQLIQFYGPIPPASLPIETGERL